MGGSQHPRSRLTLFRPVLQVCASDGVCLPKCPNACNPNAPNCYCINGYVCSSDGRQ